MMDDLDSIGSSWARSREDRGFVYEPPEKMANGLKLCPFCKGTAKLSFKQVRFGGWNFQGERRLKYRVQVICNRCHARGKPVTTDWIVNANPKDTLFVIGEFFYSIVSTEYHDKMTKAFEPYVEQAIEAWNRRDGETE